MNTLLRKLMGRVYMAPAEDDELSGGSGGHDIDLDDDDDDLDDKSAPEAKSEVKLGDQEDGSVVVELEDEGGEDDGASGKTESGEKATGEEGEDDEAAREKIREARRLERKERKERAREKEEQTRRELAAERTARKELEARLAALEGRDHSREIANVDASIKRTENAYEQAKSAYAEAVAQHDGEAAAEALETMQMARERYQQLSHAKKAYETQQKPVKSAIDPELANHAQKFMDENKWYKHGGADQDSRIVKAIDDALFSEGRLQPNSTEYWDELRSRIKKHLPHRITPAKVSTNAADQGDKRQAAPARQQKSVVGGGGGETNGAGKGTFTLSPERVRALKDAGMWDDPKVRQDAVRRFREYDKANSKG